VIISDHHEPSAVLADRTYARKNVPVHVAEQVAPEGATYPVPLLPRLRARDHALLGRRANGGLGGSPVTARERGGCTVLRRGMAECPCAAKPSCHGGDCSHGLSLAVPQGLSHLSLVFAGGDSSVG